MTTEPPTPRGTPPSTKELGRTLGPKTALWEGVIEMVKEFGATWRWMHSEATNTWSYRAYLPGDRFFAALSLVPEGIEASLNLKPDEWDYVGAETTAEHDLFDALKAKALASGDDPAWLHVPIVDQASLPALARLLFARGRRVQAPRTKKRGRR